MPKKNPIKVLHTISVKNLTGAAQPLFLLLKELSNRTEIESSVISPVSKGNISEKISKEGFRHYKDVDLCTGQSPFALSRQAIRLARIIDTEGIDILHSHLSHDNWVSVFASKLSKRNPPVIRTLHNSRAIKKRTDYGILYGNLTRNLICISELLKNRFIQNYPALSSKTSAIHASVREDIFNRCVSAKHFREKYGIGDDDFIIGMVARFKKGRGHDTMIETFELIHAVHSDTKLFLVGKGEERERIEKLAKAKNLTDAVIFTGYLKEELPAAYRAMNVACVLEEGNDGSMRTILEAMSCGIPVISMDRGSASEIIAHGERGFIAKDEATLKNSIENFFKDRGLSEKMGAKANSFIRDNYLPGAEADKHIKLYESIARA